MLEVTDGPQPSDEDLRQMCGEIEIEPLTVNDPAIDQLLDTFARTHVNIGAVLLRVRLGPHPVLDWFASRNELEDVVTRLLDRSEIRDQAPDLFEGVTGPNWLFVGPPLTLAGALAQHLTAGGAYSEFDGSMADAMRMAARFCQAVFEERYEDIVLLETHQAWSEWFGEIVWDGTYVLLDKRRRWLWLLAISDVD